MGGNLLGVVLARVFSPAVGFVLTPSALQGVPSPKAEYFVQRGAQRRVPEGAVTAALWVSFSLTTLLMTPNQLNK